MTEDPWKALAGVAPTDLRQALLEVHWAVQFIASAGQTFVEPRADDSHRAMLWDPSLRSFVGDGFAGAYPFRLSVRPEDLTLVLLDRTGAALGSLPLAGVTPEQGYEWLAVGLATYMGGPPPRIARPEYDMPPHPLADGAPFTSAPGPELTAVSALYAGSAQLLQSLLAGRPEASPVRCWPHHFDVATLLTLSEGTDDSPARTVGVGMAPMGGGYDTWYWYVTPWPYPEPSRLPALGGAGTWHVEGWTGAVLSGDSIVTVPAGERPRLVTAFATEAIKAATRALS